MDPSRRTPTAYVIAGPNGAGKTTFAAGFLPDFVNCRQFLNADLIAAGLSPFAPETQNIRAGRLLLGADWRAVPGEGRFRVRDDPFRTHLCKSVDGPETIGLPGRPVLPLAAQRRSGGAPRGQPASSRRARGSRSGCAAPVRIGTAKPLPTVSPPVDAWWLYDASRLPPLLIAREQDGILTTTDVGLFQQIQGPSRNNP